MRVFDTECETLVEDQIIGAKEDFGPIEKEQDLIIKLIIAIYKHTQKKILIYHVVCNIVKSPLAEKMKPPNVFALRAFFFDKFVIHKPAVFHLPQAFPRILKPNTKWLRFFVQRPNATMCRKRVFCITVKEISVQHSLSLQKHIQSSFLADFFNNFLLQDLTTIAFTKLCRVLLLGPI